MVNIVTTPLAGIYELGTIAALCGAAPPAGISRYIETPFLHDGITPYATFPAAFDRTFDASNQCEISGVLQTLTPPASTGSTADTLVTDGMPVFYDCRPLVIADNPVVAVAIDANMILPQPLNFLTYAPPIYRLPTIRLVHHQPVDIAPAQINILGDSNDSDRSSYTNFGTVPAGSVAQTPIQGNISHYTFNGQTEVKLFFADNAGTYGSSYSQFIYASLMLIVIIDVPNKRIRVYSVDIDDLAGPEFVPTLRTDYTAYPAASWQGEWYFVHEMTYFRSPYTDPWQAYGGFPLITKYIHPRFPASALPDGAVWFADYAATP